MIFDKQRPLMATEGDVGIVVVVEAGARGFALRVCDLHPDFPAEVRVSMRAGYAVCDSYYPRVNKHAALILSREMLSERTWHVHVTYDVHMACRYPARCG
jgi:hypothetical protein